MPGELLESAIDALATQSAMEGSAPGGRDDDGYPARFLLSARADYAVFD